MPVRRADRLWDLLAIGLSSACMLHCLAPLLIVALPPNALIANFGHEFHLLLVLLAVPVTLFVVWNEQINGYRSAYFRIVAMLGLAVLVLAATIIESDALETPLTLGGGMLLVAAHLWHWRQNHSERSSVGNSAVRSVKTG